MSARSHRLTTPRLLLRRFTTADAELLLGLDNDPEVMRYINNGEPVPREEIVDDVLPAFLRHYERWTDLGFFAAEERDSRRFCGWFHLRPGEGHDIDEPELGYRLHRFACGRGLATEGSRALIDDAFRHLGVQRVLAETMVVNTASRRVMEKCGMRLVRMFHADWPVRIPGDEHGDVEYAISRADWLADPSYAPA